MGDTWVTMGRRSQLWDTMVNRAGWGGGSSPCKSVISRPLESLEDRKTAKIFCLGPTPSQVYHLCEWNDPVCAHTLQSATFLPLDPGRGIQHLSVLLL